MVRRCFSSNLLTVATSLSSGILLHEQVDTYEALKNLLERTLRCATVRSSSWPTGKYSSLDGKTVSQEHLLIDFTKDRSPPQYLSLELRGRERSSLVPLALSHSSLLRHLPTKLHLTLHSAFRSVLRSTERSQPYSYSYLGHHAGLVRPRWRTSMFDSRTR